MDNFGKQPFIISSMKLSMNLSLLRYVSKFYAHSKACIKSFEVLWVPKTQEWQLFHTTPYNYLIYMYVICFLSEPRHDKTNKVTVRPAKAQISLGIRPVWSVFAVRLMGS